MRTSKKLDPLHLYTDNHARARKWLKDNYRDFTVYRDNITVICIDRVDKILLAQQLEWKEGDFLDRKLAEEE